MSFDPHPEPNLLVYLKKLLEKLGSGRRRRPGLRKALLIGSNYPGRGDELRIHGCRDITDMRDFLLSTELLCLINAEFYLRSQMSLAFGKKISRS
jgi:hypothetical protein